MIAKVDFRTNYHWINQLNILEVLCLSILLIIISCYLILVFKTTVFEDIVFLIMRAMDVSFGTSYYVGFSIIPLSPQIEMLTKRTVKYFSLIFEGFLLV